MTCIAVSGPIAVGKSAIATALALELGGKRLYVPDELKDLVQGLPTREALRRAGDDLATRTNGRWIADVVARRLSETALIVLDAIRRPIEDAAMRSRFEGSYVRLFLDASQEELMQRATRRVDSGLGHSSGGAWQQEPDTDELRRTADLAVDTTGMTEEQAVAVVLGNLSTLGG